MVWYSIGTTLHHNLRDLRCMYCKAASCAMYLCFQIARGEEKGRGGRMEGRVKGEGEERFVKMGLMQPEPIKSTLQYQF